MDIYREEILEHWQNPQNFGEIKGADVVIDQINPLCGDTVRFFFKFKRVKESKSERVIDKVSFTGNGCAISVAASSILSGILKGKNVEAVKKITGEDVLAMIGGKKNFPPARLKCAFLALEAVKKLDSKIKSIKQILSG